MSATLTTEEAAEVWSALEYYMDIMTVCGATHPHDDDSCEGWSPDEVAVLERAADKLIEGSR